MLKNKISCALAASLSLLTLSNTHAESDMAMSNIPGMEKCYGIAKKGRNDCATHLHKCAGEALKDAEKKEWLLVPHGLCEKIVGGNIKSSD